MATNYPNIGQTSTDFASMYINIKRDFQQALAVRKHESLFPLVSSVIKSTGKSNQYDMSFIINRMNPWLGSRTREKIALDTISLVNEKFETSLDVSRDDIDDDALGLLEMQLSGLPIIAQNFYDEKVFDVYNDHITDTETTYAAGFDGFPIFAIDHAWSYGYTTAQDNIRGVSVANAGKLDQTYGYTNIKAAIVSLENFLLPNQTRAGSKATHLLCSSSTYFDARQILESAGLNLASSATSGSVTVAERGTVNPLHGQGIQVVKCPELTSGYWVLADLSGPLKPVILQDRRPIEMARLAEGSTEYYE
ncbi:hypothetical protein LCGC14_2581800, partial [marine sediment metagenome]